MPYRRMIVPGLLGVFWVGVVMAQPLEMSYDQTNDQLSLSANDVSLTGLTSRLTEDAGIAIHVDPSLAEDRVTARVDALPLNQAIQQVFRKYSTLVQYDGRGGSARVRSLALLPKGKPSPSSHAPVSGAIVTADAAVQMPADARQSPEPGSAHNVKVQAPALAERRYLDDLRPDEKAQMNEVDLAAMPVRPPPSLSVVDRSSPPAGILPVGDTGLAY